MAVVLGIVIIYCLLQYAFKSSRRSYAMTGDQSTHNGGSMHGSSSHGGTAVGGPPSLLRSSGNFIKSIVDKTTNSKNRRPSTGRKGAYEMVPGGGNTGKSPFTIAGEDDDEDVDLRRGGAGEAAAGAASVLAAGSGLGAGHFEGNMILCRR